MAEIPVSLEKLIDEIKKIPSVGKKTAVGMAYSIVDYSAEKSEALINAIKDVKEHVTMCPVCCGLSEDGEVCDICSDPRRDRSVICVVEDFKAAVAIENVHEYRGLYHVLHGVLSPLAGITPDKIRIKELIDRLSDGEVKEVIIATDPDVEGEATSNYLTKVISEKGVKVSRLAYGMPVGGNLEYTDAGTLSRAFSGRNTIG